MGEGGLLLLRAGPEPWLCLSGRFHQVSESTHWTPFLNASVHYIRERYPPPWEKVRPSSLASLPPPRSALNAKHSTGDRQALVNTLNYFASLGQVTGSFCSDTNSSGST